MSQKTPCSRQAGHIPPTRSLGHLRARIHKFKHNALTKSTRRVHEVRKQNYKRFCKKYGLQVLPLNQSSLCLFVTYLAKSLFYMSINLYLCGVKYHNMAQGCKNRLQGMHQFYLTMRGIKRKLGVTGQQKPCML